MVMFLVVRQNPDPKGNHEMNSGTNAEIMFPIEQLELGLVKSLGCRVEFSFSVNETRLTPLEVY